MTRLRFLSILVLAVCVCVSSQPVLSADPVAPSAEPDVDVLVYGGVPCGIAAAIMARRAGASVLLLEPTRHVGGLSTSGLNTAETEHMLKWTFGGLALEFYQRLGKIYGTQAPEFYFESHIAEQAYQELLEEARVPVRFGAQVEKVLLDNQRISGIVLTDGTHITAQVYIDAGYEGDLMARAGVPYAIGREAISEYQEEGAGIRFESTPRRARTVDAQGRLLPGISGWARDYQPGAAHPGVMNYNWRLTFTRDPEQRVEMPAPRHYDPARFELLREWLAGQTAQGKQVKLRDILDLYTRRNGKLEVNNKQAAIISIGHFGGQFAYPDADYAQREAIIADHTEYTRGLLWFLAHDESVPESLRNEMSQYGLHREEFADNGNWPYQLYVREARRMRGARVVTQHDITEDRHKADAIAMGSHFIDSHHVQRLALSEEEFINEGRLWRIGSAYQIPYQALTPRSEHCRNLLVPGAASYTHVAYCTLRLESTWMMVGHAAGVAAAQAVQHRQDVQQIDVPTLQATLRSQGQIIDFLPGKPERFEDQHRTKEF